MTRVRPIEKMFVNEQSTDESAIFSPIEGVRVSSFATASLELDNIANDIVFIVVTLIVIVKQGTFCLSLTRIRQVFNDIHIYSSTLDNDEEQKILKHCFDNEKYLFNVLILLASYSYHLEHAMDLCEAQNAAERYSIIFAKLLRAIKLQKQSIKLLRTVNEIFGTCYAILLLLYVIDVTLQSYYVIQTLKLLKNDIYGVIMMLIGEFGYMYMISSIGQDIVDNAGEVLQKAYDSLWYFAPVRARKLLLVTMINSTKPMGFTMFGGLYKSGFESFSMVTGSSITLTR
ncbi:PREDICTED: uncharacterized protein LOC108550043 [Eufriesea mexicana]|uniref:uncharacterized protein LOC108550043 n=1 Tax=Eufriesea mexicana TaxID=516756 RepID=UPI00083BC4F2|nr:PREDICTED: uncharacterized protein LOC108550043 [Eufriesea mexicana]